MRSKADEILVIVEILQYGYIKNLSISASSFEISVYE